MHDKGNIRAIKYIVGLREPLYTKGIDTLLIPLDDIKYKNKRIYIRIFTTSKLKIFQIMLMKDRVGKTPYNLYNESSDSYIDKTFLTSIKLRLSTYKIIKYLLKYKSEDNNYIDFLDTEEDIIVYIQQLTERLGFHIYKHNEKYMVEKKKIYLSDIT